MRILLYGTDGKQERELICQEALGKAGVHRAGRKVVGRNREDHALAGLQFANNRIYIVFVFKDAAVVFLLQAGAHLSHLHGAALATGAGQDVVVEQIDQLDLAASLAHRAKGLFGQSLAVATVPTGTNRHHFKRHGVAPLQSILDTDSARVYFAKSVRQTQHACTVQATKARAKVCRAPRADKQRPLPHACKMQNGRGRRSYLRLKGMGLGGHLGFTAPAVTIAPLSQISRQAPHWVQAFWSITWIKRGLPRIASSSQTSESTHLLQAWHLEAKIWKVKNAWHSPAAQTFLVVCCMISPSNRSRNDCTVRASTRPCSHRHCPCITGQRSRRSAKSPGLPFLAADIRKNRRNLMRALVAKDTASAALVTIERANVQKRLCHAVFGGVNAHVVTA